MNKYEFLKRIDLNYKPNALDKASFEFSPLGKTFSTGLDKTGQGYQEEGITKLLKHIRDSLAGNVIIPARPLRPNDDGNDDNGNDDNGDDYGNDDNGNDDNGNDDNGDDNRNDNGDDKTSFIDLSWMNDLQLYKKIALEVFSRYNGDKDSFELFTLQTFIDNINIECVKNKKDAREEFKTVKKNIKSESLKQIVKELGQAIFGYDDDKDKEELELAKELDKRFKNLISKKHRELLREYLKESEDANPQDRANALKEYLKKAKYTDPQIRVNALKKNKKIKNLPKTSSDNNDDSEDYQISDFVDRVLRKVSKEIVNDDNKKVSKEIVNDENKKVSKEIVNDDNKKVSKEIVNDDNKKKC